MAAEVGSEDYINPVDGGRSKNVRVVGTDSSGNTVGLTITHTGAASVSDVNARAEALNYTDQLTNTATALLGTTSGGVCNALGLPFDSLTFTKSGTATLMTVDLHFVVGGGIIKVTEGGAETLAITATSDGTSLGNILVRDSAGTITSAAALTNGIYFLYLGK